MSKASLFLPVIDNGMGLSRTSWAVCMMALCASPIFRDRRVEIQPFSYPYPDGAMNAVTADFMRSGCDELLIIDTDVVFKPHDIEWLLSHEVEVVAGLYPKKKIGLEFPCQQLEGFDFSKNPFANPLLPVKRVARGFMRIKRGVFTKLAQCTETYDDVETGEKCFDFWRKLAGGHSEDFYFCDTWRAIGGVVYIDQRICTQHEGHALYPIAGTY